MAPAPVEAALPALLMLMAQASLFGNLTISNAGEPWHGGAPLHDLAFTESDRIVSVAFPPGGETVYVQLVPSVINLWEAGVYYWPELLGALGAAVVLVCVRFVLRVARRPQRCGEIYCRRCGYCLSGATDPMAATCPECGMSATRRRPRRGRARWKRSIPWATVAVVVVLGYAALHAFGLSRNGALATRYVLDWDWLSGVADAHGWSLLTKFRRPIERVVEVDVQSGRKLRTVCEYCGQTWARMSLSDDGRDLITMNGDGSLACRDGVRGTLRSKLPLPDHCRGTLSLWTEIAGFGGPGIVYVALLDLTDRTSRLIEWDTRAGTTRDIISELAFQWTMGTGQPMPEVRSYAVLAGDGPRFVSTPGFHEAQERGVELRAYDPRGVLVWHAEASPSVWQMPQPLASTRDGTRGFLSCSYHGIWGVNLKTGEPMGLIPPPEITEGGWDVIAPGPDGRYLFWPTVSSGHILIRDTAIKAWVAPLSHRLLGRAVPRVSPDGRWLAVAGSSPSSAAASTFVSHLLLYDISGLSSRSEDDP